ncbi:MAG: hypothetical protein WBA12_00985 [Catalinimonas sp.]
MKLNSPRRRAAARLMLGVMLLQISAPLVRNARAGGPQQPEFQGFRPAGSQEMVDPFTGDFGYNLPLLEVGDYPLTLSYGSGLSVDDDAGWVGWGWSLTPGAITRSVRGLPDDVRGEEVLQQTNLKPNRTFGLNAGLTAELFSIDPTTLVNVGLKTGLFYNTYSGVGVEVGLTPGLQATAKSGHYLTASMGINANSQSGLSVSPNVGFNLLHKNSSEEMELGHVDLGLGVSSRGGIKQLRLGYKHKNEYFGWSGKGKLSFSAPTYVPRPSLPMNGGGLTFSFGYGGEIFGLFPNGRLTGYFTQQALAERERSAPAYGYLYAEAAGEQADVLRDFNRSRDKGFTEGQPNLPFSYATYDLYQVSAQGISGGFRPLRSDANLFFDPQTVMYDAGTSLGVEIGGGNAVKGGVNIALSRSEAYSRPWIDDNKLVGPLRAAGADPTRPEFETVRFVSTGGLTATDDAAFAQAVGGRGAVRAKLSRSGYDARAEQRFGNRVSAGSQAMNAPPRRVARTPRAEVMSYLPADEATKGAYQPQLLSYPLNAFDGEQAPEALTRNADYRRGHHLSEMSVTDERGWRYVYGLPVYNTHQEEVAFNVAGRSVDCERGLVSFEAGRDDTRDNDRGIGNFFSRTASPAHAQSWLLTQRVSPDYRDLTGDGPTPDDFGDYVRFNYTRALASYAWRSPFEAGRAHYQQGLLLDTDDDRGQYVYGTREVWYLHSIESKNQVAEFYLSDREDAVSSAGTEGGADPTRRLKKLDRIDLYSRAERADAGTDAVPIQSVHFAYDYALCQGLPSHTSGGGKLTLKKVWFTYGASPKGELTPIEFDYGDVNPNYNPQALDHWGTYQPNDCAGLSNARLPYTSRHDRAAADRHAAAWRLHKVTQRGGATTTVTYEADAYTHVQDKQAMQLFKVAGFKRQLSDADLRPMLWDLVGGGSAFPMRPYLFFEIDDTITTDEQLKAYVEGMKSLYFRFRTDAVGASVQDVWNGKSRAQKSEDITGFVPYEPRGGRNANYGFDEAARAGEGYTRAWIKLEPDELGDLQSTDVADYGDVHPIAKVGWQFVRLKLPRVAYQQADLNEDNPLEQLILSLASISEELIAFLGGFNAKMRGRQSCRWVDLERSYVRLNAPAGKVGGGARVRKIVTTDAWAEMGGSGETATYGHVYTYTVTDTTAPFSVRSAGVAAYEPRVGGEENAVRVPRTHRQVRDNYWFAKTYDQLYELEPITEDLYPAATVGYAHVEKRNLPFEGVQRTATGHDEYDFYTARDFPVRTGQTDIDVSRKKMGLPLQLLFFSYRDDMATSQGYVVETNDMHGKPRATRSYAEATDGAPPALTTGTTYHYQFDDRTGQLVSDATVLGPDPAGGDHRRRTQELGVTTDFYVDTREAQQKSESVEAQINLDGFLAAIIPIFIPIIIPGLQGEETRYRSIVTTKVVRRSGILSGVTVDKFGSSVEVRNLGRDALTGRVLLTETLNEYGDSLYALEIPAYWQHDGMGPAYRNADLQLVGQTVGSRGELRLDFGTGGVEAPRYLRAGDEFLVRRTDGERFRRAWVYRVNAVGAELINEQGAYLPAGTYDLRLLRSGARNLLQEVAGSMQLHENPLAADSTLRPAEVLVANARDFSDEWQTYAAFRGYVTPDTCDCESLFPNKGEDFTRIVEELFDRGWAYDTTINLSDLISSNSDVGYALQLAGRNALYWRGEARGNQLQGYFLAAADDASADALHTLTMAFEPEPARDLSVVDIGDFNVFNIKPVRSNPYVCADTVYDFQFTANLQVVNGEGEEVLINTPVRGTSDLFPIALCTLEPLETEVFCDLIPGQVVNPYFLGVRGNYRPDDDHRLLSKVIRNDDRRHDGTYAEFVPYWAGVPGSDPARWTTTTRNLRVDPNGRSLEGEDPRRRPAARLFGHNYQLTTAEAEDARYENIAFSSYENHPYRRALRLGDQACTVPEHFAFEGEAEFVSDEAAHTGRFSLRVPAGTTIRGTRRSLSIAAGDTVNGPYRLSTRDFAGKYEPSSRVERHVVSAWVRVPELLEDGKPDPLLQLYTFDGVSLELEAVSSTTNQVFTFRPDGPIVDGWQRLYGAFTLPPGTVELRYRLLNGYDRAVFMDDLRLQPFHSGMVAYVYDPYTLRLVATLDDQNYATFLEYDLEGLLIRRKRETRAGIMTVREARRGIAKP